MTTPSAPPAFLTRNLELIEDALRAALSADDTALSDAARYVMGWQDQSGGPADARGKRLRPSLCVVAAEAFGAAPSVALPGAVAVELVHNFSLVHDEVQDRDLERHHRPTAWAIWGEAQAINIGDYLYTTAIRALSEADAPAERRLAALRVLNGAIARMIHGQWADLAFEQSDTVTTDDYIAMIRGKTGALFGAPLAMGAILAGASSLDADLVYHWGEQVGLAFQVQDDYLGVWGSPETTGKSNTNDIARKKKSLPVVHGLQHGATAPLIRAAFEREEGPGDDEVAAIIAALGEAGSADATRAYAEHLATEAATILDQVPLPAADRDRLREVGDYFVRRTF